MEKEQLMKETANKRIRMKKWNQEILDELKESNPMTKKKVHGLK